MTEDKNLDQLKRIVEGALLAAGEALSVERLLSLFEEEAQPEKADLQSVLETLKTDFAERGFHLVEVASGWRFQVNTDLAPWVNKLWEEKPQKYSRALLETLSLIAYRQPLTRGDIEEVRGVAVSSHIIKTLAEREWIKVVGHRDVPGRPSLYATTRQFLDYFGLKSLDELPSLSELKDIDSLNSSLNLGDDQDDESGQIADAKADMDGLDDQPSTPDAMEESQPSLEQAQVDVARDEADLEQWSADTMEDSSEGTGAVAESEPQSEPQIEKSDEAHSPSDAEIRVDADADISPDELSADDGASEDKQPKAPTEPNPTT